MSTSRPTKAEQAEIEDAREKLLEWLSPGDEVYTILRHVSRSGMSRDISVVILRDGEALHPNWLVAKVIGRRMKSVLGSDAIECGGYGMDTGFDLVYSLSRRLWPDGFACIDLERKCEHCAYMVVETPNGWVHKATDTARCPGSDNLTASPVYGQCPSNDHVNRHHCDRFDDDGRRVAPMVVTCGGCGRSWCERCDPAPSALCHWCHGRGESFAELPETRKHHKEGGYALKQRWM